MGAQPKTGRWSWDTGTSTPRSCWFTGEGGTENIILVEMLFRVTGSNFKKRDEGGLLGRNNSGPRANVGSNLRFLLLNPHLRNILLVDPEKTAVLDEQEEITEDVLYCVVETGSLYRNESLVEPCKGNRKRYGYCGPSSTKATHHAKRPKQR